MSDDDDGDYDDFPHEIVDLNRALQCTEQIMTTLMSINPRVR